MNTRQRAALGGKSSRYRSTLAHSSSPTNEVFRREDEYWALLLEADDDEKVRAEPFESIEIDLSRLWTL